MAVLATLVLFASALAIAFAQLDILSDAFIDLINSKQTSWKAGRNFAADTPMSHILKLTGGVLKDSNHRHLPSYEHDAGFIDNLPENFDPRDKWPNCPSLNEIRDQGACGSCWAFGAVEAMTDRVCTYSNGAKQFHYSAADLTSCCRDCTEFGNGCDGGHPSEAWKFWVSHGLVSGGTFNSSEGCKPYFLPPCDHTGDGTKPPCAGHPEAPICNNQCEDGYDVPFEQDKHRGRQAYKLIGEDNIMAELFKNGPVEAAFDVYGDFLSYKIGVYEHIHGDYLAGHAIKMMGWGVENGKKYWLLANSWNEEWGQNGFFKILRGANHCEIESLIVAGEP